MQSYTVVRALIFEPDFGVCLGAGDLDEEVRNQIRESLKLELSAEGIESDITVKEFSVGRSAEALSIILLLGGGAVASLAAVKNIDDGILTLKKWGRALRKWLKGREDVAALSVETLKLMCLVDLAERVPRAQPCFELIRASAFGSQWGDGTWRLIAPIYVVIPDKSEPPVSHFYLVSPLGEILHYNTTPPFELKEAEKYQHGPVQQLAAPKEPQRFLPRTIRTDDSDDQNK